MDDGKANITIRNINKHLSALQSECINNDNISSQHLGRKGLHLNPKGKGRLALNFMKQIRKFSRSLEHLNESFLPFDLLEKILRKSENLLSKPLNEETTYGIRDLKHLRNENPFRVIIGHVNINSIRNTFEPLVKYFGNNLDILMVSETKIDDTFPESQFLIEGFSTPYRLDRMAKGGGILLYIILLGDFNVEVEEKNMSEFMNLYNLRNLVKQKTCFKNPENPSCIDLILNNSQRSFQNSNVFETGLSDFHKLTTTVLKQYFPKLKPKVVNYREYRKFHKEEFRALLDNEILKHDINNMEYQNFLNIFIGVLNNHAPMKQKYLKANQGRFMTKNLHKAIMKRSRLRNEFLSDRTEIS